VCDLVNVSGFSLPLMEHRACTIALHRIVLLAISLASAYVFLMLFNSKGINWNATTLFHLWRRCVEYCPSLAVEKCFSDNPGQHPVATAVSHRQNWRSLFSSGDLYLIGEVFYSLPGHFETEKHREWRPDYLFIYRLRLGDLQSQTAGSAASYVANHCDLQSLFKNLEQVNESKVCFKQLRTYSICGWKRITNEVTLGPLGWFLKDILIQNRSNVLYNSSRLVYCLKL